MNPYLDKLIDNLEGQEKLCESLLSVLALEKAAVIGSDLDKLNELVCEKESLISMSSSLENQRKRTMERLAEALDCEKQPLTLKDLTPFIGEPYLTRVENCKQNLLSLIKRIHRANRKNMLVLGHSVKLVKGALSLLNNIAASDGVYYRTGRIGSANQHGRVISGDI